MVYKYVGACSDVETIKLLKYFYEQQTLMISKPASFNDPAEFKVNINFDTDEATARTKFFEFKKDASQKEYEEWRNQDTEQSRWWIKQQARATLFDKYGVFCTSAVDDSCLMWSHYAMNHTGFCVGLEESELSNLNGLVDHGFVAYQDEAPLFRYYVDPPGLLDSLYFTYKSSCWSYEREYRFIFDKSGLTKFPGVALKEIILGCRAHMSLKAYANTHCATGNTRFYQMVEDFQAYRLHKRPVKENMTYMSSFV